MGLIVISILFEVTNPRLYSLEMAELGCRGKAQLLATTLTVLLRGRAWHTVVNMLNYLLPPPPFFLSNTELHSKDYFQRCKDQSHEKLEQLYLRHPVERQ